MRTLRRLLVTLTVAALASAAIAPAAAAERGSDRAAVDRAVAAGRLDPATRAAIRATGVAEALVTFGEAASGGDRVPGYLDRLGVARWDGTAGPDRAARTAVAIAAADRALAAAGPGIEVRHAYASFPVRVVRVHGEAALAHLLERSGVVRVRADALRQPALAQSLALIRQPAAMTSGWTGAGTAVAVIDTGVDWTRDAFRPGTGGCTAAGAPADCRVVYARDFAPSDGLRDDGSQHGTNVAGIVLGVAPDTRILALDVFTSEGARDTWILAAIDWVIANRGTYGIRAINLSLGGEAHTGACDVAYPDFAAAFARVRDAGVLPVVAAGNDASSGGVYRDGVAVPACISEAVAVGAVYDGGPAPSTWGSSCTNASTAADQVVCWSQAGSMLDLLAPGAVISAAGISQAGTSQAAPHVSGAVAALWDARPSAAPAQVEAALEGTGRSILDARNGRTYRRIDVAAAGAELGKGPAWSVPAAAAPAMAFNEGMGLARTLDGTTSRLHEVVVADVVSGVPVADGGPAFQAVTYRRSSDGVAWTSRRLNPTSQHGSRVAIAASGSRVHVAWVQTRSVDGLADPSAPSVLWVRSSADHGATWGTAVRLSPTTGRVDYPSIAASGSRVHVAWTDANTGAVRMVRSTNGGATFGAAVQLGTADIDDADGFGRLSWPVVAATGSTVAVAWLGASDPAARVRVRVSADGGASWGTTTLLAASGAWSLSAAAMSGRVGVAWDGGETVKYREWSGGAWGGTRTVARFRAPGGYWPAVALQGTGRVGVAWTNCSDGTCERTELRWAESATNGTSWTPPRIVVDPASSGLRRASAFPSVVWPSAGTRHVLFTGYGTSGGASTYRPYLVTGTGSP